jgi:hypothetical protein
MTWFYISDQLEPVLVYGRSSIKSAPKLSRDYFLASKASIPLDNVEIVDGKTTIVTKMRPSPDGRIPLQVTKTGIGFISGRCDSWDKLMTFSCHGLGSKWVEKVTCTEILLEHVK